MSASFAYPDFVVSRLSSPNHAQVAVGLSVIYFCEFVKIYLGPVLYGGLRALLSAVLPKTWSAASPASSEHSVSVDEILAQQATQMEKERYKSDKEDKKSSKGTENDLYMLRTHGYNKYRFVSPSFIQRNKLKKDND